MVDKPLPAFSTGTKIILRVLGDVVDGEVIPKELGFSALKRCYFGLGRAKSQATTSFYNQLQNQLEKEVVTKTPNKTYTLGKVGIELRLKASREKVDLNVKSEAQQKWELANPKATSEEKAIVNS